MRTTFEAPAGEPHPTDRASNSAVGRGACAPEPTGRAGAALQIEGLPMPSGRFA